MISPRITREAYPMNRLRSGNAAPSRPEISRYASWRSVVIAADTTGTLHPHAERQPVFPGNADSEIGGESLMKRDEFIAQRRAPPVVEPVGERPRRAVAERERV